jgi:DNA replication and repair protein RecF
MDLRYDLDVTSIEFEDRLKRNQEKDIRFGTTSVGPHRDDLIFDLNGVDLRKYGSQGQQRTAALSLKLSEIDLVIQKNDEKPILLLDDVLSELDANRQEYLMNHLDGIQTFITCTGVEDFIKQNMREKRFYQVIGGEIA